MKKLIIPFAILAIVFTALVADMQENHSQLSYWLIIFCIGLIAGTIAMLAMMIPKSEGQPKKIDKYDHPDYYEPDEDIWI